MLVTLVGGDVLKGLQQKSAFPSRLIKGGSHP